MSISICVEKTQNIPPEENLGNSFFPEKKNDVSQSKLQKNGRDTRPYEHSRQRKYSLVVLFLFYISKKTLFFSTIMGRHRKNSPRKSAGVRFVRNVDNNGSYLHLQRLLKNFEMGE